MKKFLSLMLAVMLVLSCLSSLCFAADADCSYTVNGTEETEEGTIYEAFKAVSAKGGAIKLLRDVDLGLFEDEKGTYQLISESALSLDLAGHALTGDRMIKTGGKGVPGVTHIYDSVGGGIISGKKMPIMVINGGIHLENLTIWSDEQQCVSYLDATGDWNEQNLIENCVMANNAWGSLSFNSASATQEKTCITIRNSVIAAVKTNGRSAIVRQAKAVAANVELGENVTLLNYTAKTPVQGGIRVLGEKLVKQDTKETFTILDKTFEDMDAWKTADVSSTPVTEIPENPLDRVQGYVPAVSPDPSAAPQQPEEPAQTPEAEPEIPVEEQPDTVVVKQSGDFLAVADVILSALCVVLLVLLLVKKKK